MDDDVTQVVIDVTSFVKATFAAVILYQRFRNEDEIEAKSSWTISFIWLLSPAYSERHRSTNLCVFSLSLYVCNLFFFLSTAALLIQIIEV